MLTMKLRWITGISGFSSFIRCPRAFLIMSYHFNLYPHIILPKPSYANCRPNRAVVWHPLFEVSGHSLQCLVVQRYVIRVDSENLRPSLASSVFQIEVDIGERLVDLGVDFEKVLPTCGIPSTFSKSTVIRIIRECVTSMIGQRGVFPYLDLHIQFGCPRGLPGCTHTVHDCVRQHQGRRSNADETWSRKVMDD